MRKLSFLCFLILSTLCYSQNITSLKASCSHLIKNSIRDSLIVDSVFKTIYIIHHQDVNLADTLSKSFLKNAIASNDNYLKAKAYLIRGIVCDAKDLSIESINNLNISIKFFDENIPSKNLCFAYQLLALQYKRTGNFNLTEKYAIKALALAIQLKNNVLITNSYNFFGVNYNREKKYKKAKYFFHKVIQYRLMDNDINGLANAYLNIGISCRNLGELDSSLYYANNAVKIAIDNKNNYNIAFSYNDIGATYLLENKIDSAIKYLEKSKLIREESNDNFELSYTYGFLANAYEKIKQHDKALLYYYKSKDLSLKTNNQKQLHECYSQLSNYFLKLKKFDSAYIYQAKHALIKDSLFLIDKILSSDALIASYRFSDNEKEIKLLNETTKNQKLKIQKQKLYLVLIAIGIAFLITIVILIIRSRKQSADKLLLEFKLEQESNKRAIDDKIQQEKERISRDLHDNVGGQLSYILYSLDDIDNDDKQKRLDLSKNINETIRSVIANLRETIWAINDENITISNVSDKLKMYTRQMFKNTNTKVIFEETILNDICLNSLIGLNLFRICQEIINNTFKYAQANELKIIIKSDSKIEINISDNGKGFDIKSINLDTYGLKNIKSRADESLIAVNFNSIINKATTYSLVITP